MFDPLHIEPDKMFDVEVVLQLSSSTRWEIVDRHLPQNLGHQAMMQKELLQSKEKSKARIEGSVTFNVRNRRNLLIDTIYPLKSNCR